MSNASLLAVVTKSERIKKELASLDMGEKSAALADVLTDYILSLPPESQTPMFCNVLAGIEGLIDARTKPAGHA